MHESIKIRKDFIRKEILKKRDFLSSDERLEMSTKIVNRLLALPEIIKSASIFTYVSFRSEVYTHRMAESFLECGKTVSVPLINMKRKTMVPCIIKSFKDDLVPGVLGILEPDVKKINPIQSDEIDIVIMPGAVFSIKGYRIGYGGGFYDRFLNENNIRSYAIAFDFQVVDEVPFDPEFDMKVDFILTEKRFIKCP